MKVINYFEKDGIDTFLKPGEYIRLRTKDKNCIEKIISRRQYNRLIRYFCQNYIINFMYNKNNITGTYTFIKKGDKNG